MAARRGENMAPERQLRDTIPLPNGLTAEVWDESRDIAVDTVQVVLCIEVAVPLQASYFDAPDAFAATREAFGPAPTYSYSTGRAFVRGGKREAVFAELLANFKRDVVSYLSHPDFPRRFARTRHQEIVKNWYRYFPPAAETEEETE
jgi:hypothetical protein